MRRPSVFQFSEAIRETFTFFDLNGDKRIDQRELRFAFSSMVLDVPIEQNLSVVDTMFLLKTPFFAHIWNEIANALDKASCFIIFSAPANEVECILSDLFLCATTGQGEVMSDEALQKFIDQFDDDHNGTFDEVLRRAYRVVRA